jgi:Zn-dependent protease with chaperone function
VRSFPGSYNDGKTAARRRVSVTAERDGLRIADESGAPLDRFLYSEIEAVDELAAPGELRLKRRGGAARLAVADDALLSALPPEVARTIMHGGSRRGPVRGLLGVSLGICAAAVFLWLAFPFAVGAAAGLIPVSWEEALGDWVLGDAIEFFSLIEDGPPGTCQSPSGHAALDGLVDEFAAVADAPYRFEALVLDMEMVNAFALPGGKIVLFRGLIDFADSPEEVAGVVAHEMGHVIERHGTEVILRNLGLAALVDALMGGAQGSWAGDVGEALIGLSYSREAENEADTAALGLLHGTGIRADGLGRFFERIGERHGDMPGALNLLSSHPSSEARARMVAAAGSGGTAGMSDAEWQALREICGG